MSSHVVPPFISEHVFAFATEDVGRASQILRVARLAESHESLNEFLLSDLLPLSSALPVGLPRSRASLRCLQDECTRLRLSHERSLRNALRIVLFAPRTERASAYAALNMLRSLASPSKLRVDTLRDLVGLLRLVATRCVSRDAFARQRLDAGLFAAVMSIRQGSTGALPSPRSILKEFATARLLLSSRNGPTAREGEQRLPLQGGRVQLPSGGAVHVTASVETGVCVVSVYNVGDMEVWVTRVDVSAACNREMHVLLPPPTMAQIMLRRQPSLVVRGGALGGSGSAGVAWAAVWVR